MTGFNPEWLQANILKHHGRAHALHIFLQFKPSEKQRIKVWLSALPLTSAAEQLAGTAAYNKLRQKATEESGSLNDINQFLLNEQNNTTIRCFYITALGLTNLGLSTTRFETALTEGMKGRQQKLDDPLPGSWDFSTNTQQDICGMLLLANNNKELLQKEWRQIRYQLPAGVTVMHEQAGEVLRNEHGLGIEHFGYVDGISQPDLLGETQPGKHWSDMANPLDVCLFPDPLAAEETAMGSYFVFRKLEQNVKAFKDTEEELGEDFKLPDEQAGAFVVGRFEDGTPITKYAEERHITNEKGLENDFNYDKDNEGERCPYHAHIRAVNPRQNPPGTPKTRIVRRGIPYDEAGRNGRLEWLPDGKVGLLFMCFQKSIENQFETIQAKWANRGDLGSRQVGKDGIIGQGNNATDQLWPTKWNDKTKKWTKSFSGFVTLRGGDYFYAPSLLFFNNLK